MLSDVEKGNNLMLTRLTTVATLEVIVFSAFCKSTSVAAGMVWPM